MRRLMKYFRGYEFPSILGTTLKLTEAILELFIPLIVANIIDIGIKNGDVNYILQRGGLLIFLAVACVVSGVSCQYLAAKVSHGYGKSLRKIVFEHVFKLSAAQTNEMGVSTLITRCINDVTNVQTGINMFIRLATRVPFLATGAIVMAFVTNWKIALIFLITTPIICGILYYVTTKSLPMYAKIQKNQDNVTKIAGESFDGVRVIRAFSRQKLQEKDFKNEGEELAQSLIRVGKLSAMLNPVTYVVVNIAIIAIIWFGAGFANVGVLQSGDVFALVNYMTQTLLALIVFVNLVVTFNKMLASAKRIADILDTDPSMKYPSESAKPIKTDVAIEFENVGFGYTSGTELAVKNISFKLNKGESMGVIGGTGCGKTTIAKLLMRTYDPAQGSVKVCGLDAKNYTEKDINSMIGYVPQQARLFTGTIKENLKLGNDSATNEELWNALEIAQGAEFVRKTSKQLDSFIEEQGKNLSGGQKQRLTIARAIAKKPEVLVLDDSASALDYATEKALRMSLKNNLSETALFIISQRASSIKNCTQILVLNDGVCEGIGSHEELLKTCDVYKEICLSQGIVQEVNA